MRAVVLDVDDKYRVTELPDPEPGPGEVAIRVAWSGVQWGDVLVRDGHFPTPRPFVPGFEAAGRISAVGDGVDPARIGQPVTALTTGGAHAEVVTAPAALTLDATGLDPRTAAGFGWATPTAHDLISTVARVRPGDRVLVHAAAGGVGTLAGQFARLAGAARVVGVATDTAYPRQFGYHDVVPRADFPDALADTEFDVILDPVGGPTRLANLRLLAPHGRLLAYGNLATFDPVPFSTNDLLARGLSVLTHNSNLLARTHPDRLAASAAAALRLLVTGQVRVDITAEHDLADLSHAVDHLTATPGRTLLRVAGQVSR
jgi:NADPH2:quinone reductase